MNPLRMAVLFVSLGIIALLLVYKYTPGDYEIPAEKALVNDTLVTMVDPYEMAMLLSDSTDEYIIIDVRDAKEFEKNHLKNTVNVPASDILDSKIFKKNKKRTAIILAENELKASDISFVLNQTGMNTRPVAGGFTVIESYLNDMNNPSLMHFSAEKQDYSYGSFIRQTEAATEKSDVPVKKLSNSQGGC